MNFRIYEIEKNSYLEKGKMYTYIVWIGLTDNLNDFLPLRVTHYDLLDFKGFQLSFLQKHDRVLSMGKDGTLASWESIVDEALRLSRLNT